MIENGIERSNCIIHLPDDIEFKSMDGLFFKGMIMAKKGTIVAQHAHEYYHTSLLARGSVKVIIGERGSEFLYRAPAFIPILEKVKHWFESLEDDTHIYCIHNTGEGGEVKIHEENNQLRKVA